MAACELNTGKHLETLQMHLDLSLFIKALIRGEKKNNGRITCVHYDEQIVVLR